MSKKIILLALAAAGVAAFALPATAMAVEEDVPLHVVPKPEGVKKIDVEGVETWTTVSGNFACEKSEAAASFTTSTTGTFEQTFTGCNKLGGLGQCTSEGQPAGVITTKTLEFHLVTVEDSVTHATGPGILITTNAGTFATFNCSGGKVVIGGNGLIGTITKPKCGESSNEPTIEFSSSSTGVQTHKTVVGTPKSEYSLTVFGFLASFDWAGIFTFGTEQPKLECT
jgi:hypothetical protein